MLRRATVMTLGTAVLLLAAPAPAEAHGFESTVYAEIIGAGDEVRTTLQLEYDLFVVSAADTQRDDPLFRAGTEAFEARDTEGQAAALNAHAATATRYVTERFTVAGSGGPCAPARTGGFTMGEQEGVPYATLQLTWTCKNGAGGHAIRSDLFPAGEDYVRQSKTSVTYDLDARRGTTMLDAARPEFSTERPWYQKPQIAAALMIPAIAAAAVILRRRRSSRSGHSRS